MNRFVYQYCGRYQLTAGTTNYIDGIVILTHKVTTMERYRELKELISRENKDKLTITNLSFMGREQDCE
jgi:hypothetical protein